MEESGAIDCLTCAMAAYRESACIQIHGCAALLNLARWEGSVRKMKELNVEGLIETAMTNFASIPSDKAQIVALSQRMRQRPARRVASDSMLPLNGWLASLSSAGSLGTKPSSPSFGSEKNRRNKPA
jgi:hypothetical protein